MPLLLIPLSLFALVVLEIWLLVKMSGAIGFLPTIALVFGAGIVGTWVARWQGFRTVARFHREMQQGTLPARTVGDGVLILLAGVLLILPGVLSDVLGLMLLIPPVRRLVMLSFLRMFSPHWQVNSKVWIAPLPGEDTVRGSSTIVDARVIDAHVVEE
jgi:UPF0716 protein FxsA